MSKFGAQHISIAKEIRSAQRELSIVYPSRRTRKTYYFRLLSSLGRLHPIQKLVADLVYSGEQIEKATRSVKSLNFQAAWRKEQDGHYLSIKDRLTLGRARDVFVGDKVLRNASLERNSIVALPIALSSIKTVPTNSIYIINNNDIYEAGINNYIKLYLSSPEAIFVIWDWDNHHALSSSMILAAFSDLYVPAHFDFYSQLAALSTSVSAPVWAGTNQWSRDFLQRHKVRIMNTHRSEEPLGRHVSYPQFPRRAEGLLRLNSFFPEVGPIGPDYHELGAEERLDKWCAHMAHWVLPVRNDVSIRIFDALITGGVPIVPRTLQHHPALACFREHIEFYGPMDIEDPLAVTGAAIAKFKQGGVDAIAERFELAFEHCHIDSRLHQIVDRLTEHYGCS